MRTAISPDSANKPHLTALVEFLHRARENDTMSLTRQLHDEMGTLLVAAAMELCWLESKTIPSEAAARVDRLGHHLADAIIVNRQLIERLRPSLLDTFGLFEAARWLFRDAWEKKSHRSRSHAA